MSQPEHEYIKRLARAFEKGVKFKRSDINNIEVGHDDGSSKKSAEYFQGVNVIAIRIFYASLTEGRMKYWRTATSKSAHHEPI